MTKIIIFSKHFWPENFKINLIAKELVTKGYKVDVLTSNPNYIYKKNENYKNNFFLNKKKWNGVNIFYLPIYKRKNYNWLSIFFNYFSHFVSCFFYCHFFLKKKYDLVFVFGTSPIFQSLPAAYFSFLKRKPLILWVQDLWPDSLKDTGYIKNKFFLRILKYLVKLNYLLTDLILVQSNNFKLKIKKDFNLKKKILTHYNLSELNFQKFLKPRNKKFTIVYSGNFGKAQDFKTLFQTLHNSEIKKNFNFRLIGAGKKFNDIRKYVIKSKLNNSVKIQKYMSEKKLYKIL